MLQIICIGITIIDNYDIYDNYDNYWQVQQFSQQKDNNSNKDNDKDNPGTDYNSENQEPEFMTIFVTWQLRVTLDSIRNSCDV